MRTPRFEQAFKRIVCMAISISIVTTLVPLPVQKANAAEPIETLATEYQPTISETIDANGFKHPGMGFTKEILENMRTQVRAKKEPWNTYFNNMLTTGGASRTPTIRNVDGADPTKPRFYGLDSQGVQSLFISDAMVAYTQAILYYVTGDEVYRANAMRIMRLYEQMDPARFVYYTDSHIHTGIPLSRMLGAAEILRYTSTQNPALAWTEDDTARLSNNFIVPVMQTFNSCNCRFMNQHLYTTLAKMSGSIFMGDRANYEQAVEWFTVNKDAVDQGQNGAIKRLFRLVTRNDATGEEVAPAVQHVEMGRDQAHGAGDITNAQLLSRLMMAQGTKVDPVEGTISTAPDAVGPYEFLGDRILDAGELFSTYMLGKEIPWVPTASHTDAAGNPTIVYHTVSGSYRGRTSSNTWEMFYYYQYNRGVNMEQRAPNFTRFFDTRRVYSWDGADGGGDFWLAIPAAAEAEGGKYLVNPVVDPLREIEDRFTPLDEQSVAMNDGTAFVRVTARPEGSRLAVYGYGSGGSQIGLRIRTNGLATLKVWSEYQLPDTQGQWRYVILPIAIGDYFPMEISGQGTQVDIDHVNVNSSTVLTAPQFTLGEGDAAVHTYTGATGASTLNFAATDANAADVVSYQAINLPAGASFDNATGAFSWKPLQTGSYAFVVQATDGTTISTKRVSIVVDPDRQAMVTRVTTPYNANTHYVASTQAAYTSAYTDLMNTIGTSADADYFQKLGALKSAVAGLEEMNPLLPDGSLNFIKMFASSDYGSGVAALMDNSRDTAAGFASNLVNNIDLGPDFKIAASHFQVQPVAGFPERMGGVAIFGSNDKENWTRLTPGLTTVLDALQDAPVAEDLKNSKFRFFKLHMLEPFVPVYQPYAILHPSELRIFGTRYATVNKLSAVSLGSAQALKNRVVSGDTITLSFQSTEPINNVTATLQGQPVPVASADNLNWTATAAIDNDTPVGPVKFVVNYRTAQGEAGEPTLFTTDGSGLFIADQKDYLANLLDITTVTDSSGRNAADALTTVSRLFDKNITSGTDYRVNGSGYGGWVAFDFRAGGTVQLSRVDIIGLQDRFSGRIAGAVVQGSNDYATWTTISNGAGNTSDWQTLKVTDTTPYRYVRIYNGNQWFGNMTELRFYGKAASTQRMASASISSPQALRKRIVPGNSVTVTFKAKEAVSNVTATIQGQTATVSTVDNLNFTATATLAQGVATGAVKFAVNYTSQEGQAGYPLTEVTDGSSLNLVDESDVIQNIPTIATLIDSTTNRSAATTLAIVKSMFDANLGTGTDFRNGSGGSGWGSWVTFDFKSGNQVTLTGVEVIANQDQYYTRIKGMVVQGSNDNATWDTLTPAAVSTQEWQTLPVASLVPYRYIRVYNPNQWFGNLRELRLHGSLQAADVSAPVTTATAPQGVSSTDATVTFTAADNGGSGVAATYYTVNGGAQQSGKSVTLATSGVHTVAYWSRDWAGNVEQSRTLTVEVDKSVDLTANVAIVRSGLTMNRFTFKYTGTVTITNNGASALTGPLQFRLQELSAGVTLDNKTGDKYGVPYMTLPSADLAPGQSVTLTTTFSNPGKVSISYTPVLIGVR